MGKATQAAIDAAQQANDASDRSLQSALDRTLLFGLASQHSLNIKALENVQATSAALRARATARGRIRLVAALDTYDLQIQQYKKGQEQELDEIVKLLPKKQRKLLRPWQSPVNP